MDNGLDRDVVIDRALKIPGWYPRENLERLWAIAHWAKRVQPEKLWALEVGTWYGRSAYVLGHVADVLYCIDTWKGLPQAPDDPRYKESLTTDMLWAVKQHLADIPAVLYLCQGTSTEELRNLPADTFGLVHVDGDHSSPVIDLDVKEAHRVTIPQGYICGDDYNEPDVKQAVETWLGRSRINVYMERLWWMQK